MLVGLLRGFERIRAWIELTGVVLAPDLREVRWGAAREGDWRGGLLLAGGEVVVAVEVVSEREIVGSLSRSA